MSAIAIPMVFYSGQWQRPTAMCRPTTWRRRQAPRPLRTRRAAGRGLAPPACPRAAARPCRASVPARSPLFSELRLGARSSTSSGIAEAAVSKGGADAGGGKAGGAPTARRREGGARTARAEPSAPRPSLPVCFPASLGGEKTTKTPT